MLYFFPDWKAMIPHTIRFLIAALFILAAPRVEAAPFWVFFSDRGPLNVGKAVAAKIANPAEPKNTSRRAKAMGSAIFDERDLPVNPAYIAAVAGAGGRIRTATRYFNGVSADLDGDARARVEKLTFVTSVRPVVVSRRPVEPRSDGKPAPGAPKAAALSYGNSFNQLSLVGVIKLQDRGYFGDGIRIGLLDSGFDNLGHAAFDSIRVEGEWDFVDRDATVGGDDHGSEVLSIIAALDRGNMIGAAPHATFFLARTEIINAEDTRVEEDYWVAGIEWADSLGADIVSSSVGYTTFSDGAGYTYADLNGETAVTTRAADIAVEKGIVVVNSAGNEGDLPWYYVVTPADGKGVIAVGSVRIDDSLNIEVSAFSSRGPTFDGRVKPDFVALGENVEVVNAVGNGYQFKNGTSFSAPAVAGASALLLQLHPDWSPAALYDSLLAAAIPAGADTLAGHGRIDAFASSGLSPEETTAEGFSVFDPYPQPIVFARTGDRVYFPLDVPVAGRMLSIRIFTFSGEKIWSLEQTVPAAGSFRDRSAGAGSVWDGRSGAPFWNGLNYTGDPVASGIYYYSIRLSGFGGHRGKIAVIR
jgi:serine protease AprX